MHITAHVRNAGPRHDVGVSTAGSSRTIQIPPSPAVQGSSVNGGELLMLAWPPATAMTSIARLRG